MAQDTDKWVSRTWGEFLEWPSNCRILSYDSSPLPSQWPLGLRLLSAAACLLALRVRIPPAACMSVCCDCCVFTGRGICDGLITRPEE